MGRVSRAATRLQSASAIALLAAALALPAAAAPEPWAGPHKHLGPASCGGGNCHGAAKPVAGSAVANNEFFTWESKDAHSNAYKLLLTDAGRRIAANLGIKAAHEDPACLTCHSDHVPPALRAQRWQVGDGIGCEGCHGGAEQWNKAHVAKGATHAGNVAAGLYPLDDPAARARVCLHCHMGSDQKPIDHRTMGAGHPPLSFELDTFTAIQPAHFVVDADYKSRKGGAGNLRTWAAGQAVAAEFFLDGLIGGRFRQAGLTPELVFFDCNACHHPMKPPRWNSSVAVAQGPGEVRFADAYLVMTGHVISAVMPERAAEWDGALEALHRASRGSMAQAKEAASRMRRLATEAANAATQKELSRAQALAILERLTGPGERKAVADCTAAEQVVYAIGVINESLKAEGVKSLEASYNGAVDAVNCRRGDFSVKNLQDNLRKAREAGRKLRGG